jgi:hypothetical protein
MLAVTWGLYKITGVGDLSGDPHGRTHTSDKSDPRCLAVHRIGSIAQYICWPNLSELATFTSDLNCDRPRWLELKQKGQEWEWLRSAS